MIEDDPQVEHIKIMQAMNPMPQPAYYPKAALKGAIKDLVHVLRLIRLNGYSKLTDHQKRKIDIMIEQYEGYYE